MRRRADRTCQSAWIDDIIRMCSGRRELGLQRRLFERTEVAGVCRLRRC
jgi:hypothetical protein